MSDDPLFRGLEPPAVPAHLREGVLAAARLAFATAPPPLDVWARLVSSRVARLAWAASVAALAVANILLPRNARPRASYATSSAETPDPEIASIARLPRVDEHALPALEGDRS